MEYRKPGSWLFGQFTETIRQAIRISPSKYHLLSLLGGLPGRGIRQSIYSCRTAAILEFIACIKNILMDITVYLLRGATEIILQIPLLQGQLTTLNCALRFMNTLLLLIPQVEKLTRSERYASVLHWGILMLFCISEITKQIPRVFKFTLQTLLSSCTTW